MSINDIVVSATTRTAHGKSDVKRLRKEGQLPGVIYGSGEAATSVQLNAHEFEQLLKKHASHNFMLDLKVGDGKPRKVLIKEVQRHPVSKRALHADFNAVSLTKKIDVEISLEFTGIPQGVSLGGGTLDVHIRSIEVECLPQNVVESFEVDVSALGIGQHLAVKDIVLDTAKYTLSTDPDISIASVAAPRVADDVVAEAAADAGPEVITEKKEEEDAS